MEVLRNSEVIPDKCIAAEICTGGNYAQKHK
jgi:hypothetical protein